MRRLLTALLVLSFVLQSSLSVFAQEEPAGEDGTDTVGKIFLPMVGQGASSQVAAEQTPTSEQGFQP
nr:hypothetical protein [Caldilineaceae bacterium]